MDIPAALIPLFPRSLSFHLLSSLHNSTSQKHSYTAFIAPISSARLHSEAKSQSCLPLNTNEGPASPSVGMQRALETPYVVRSHSASQSHEEQACWTFSHPHPSSHLQEAEEDMDIDNNSATLSTLTPSDAIDQSAKAARNVNNDRHAYLSFCHDPTHGARLGCGYGAPDAEVASIALPDASSADDDNCSSTDETAFTIHGFLGTFHSVLYESLLRKTTRSAMSMGSTSPHRGKRFIQEKMQNSGKDNEDVGQMKRSSVISIAPHSFSVGMFSWFPLVSDFNTTIEL